MCACRAANPVKPPRPQKCSPAQRMLDRDFKPQTHALKNAHFWGGIWAFGAGCGSEEHTSPHLSQRTTMSDTIPTIVVPSDTESEYDSDCFVVTVTVRRKRKSAPSEASSAKRPKPATATARTLADRTYDAAYRTSKAEALWTAALTVVGDADFTAITTEQTLALARLIDTMYFDGLLGTSGYTLSTGSNAGKCAGKCQVWYQEKKVVVKLNHALFLSIPTGVVRVANGLRCRTRLEALLNVLQHEMVHAIICCTIPASEQLKGLIEPHGPLFRKLARELFGHTDIKQRLRHKYDSTRYMGIEDRPIKGQRVRVDIHGEWQTGIVQRLYPRRALVQLDSFCQRSLVSYGLIERPEHERN